MVALNRLFKKRPETTSNVPHFKRRLKNRWITSYQIGNITNGAEMPKHACDTIHTGSDHRCVVARFEIC